MAYYGSGYNSNGSVFGGYAGGYNQTPDGFLIGAPNTNIIRAGFPSAPGLNLPSVDPNNYPGVVHYGPPSAIIGPQPVSFLATPGFVDPNLAVIGTPYF